MYVVDVERRKNGHKFEEQNWRGEEGRRNFLGHILAHRLSERDSLVTCRSVAILFDTCLRNCLSGLIFLTTRLNKMNLVVTNFTLLSAIVSIYTPRLMIDEI